jgi:hypothetical protein
MPHETFAIIIVPINLYFPTVEQGSEARRRGGGDKAWKIWRCIVATRSLVLIR